MVLLLVALLAAYAGAQASKNANHMVPNGKGWAVENSNAPSGGAVVTGNGINYNGGPVMKGNPVNVYFIWYGNWAGSGSNTAATVSQLQALYSSTGLNNSGYEKINSTYGDTQGNVSGSVIRTGTDSFPGYTNGTRLRDSAIQSIVTNYINNVQGGTADASGLYFVLTSSDVNETSGFCTKYCGWHTHATINGTDVKYSFVGNPDRCPSACEAESTPPAGVTSGANGMSSIMAHETEEAISDPDLNAWYDSSGAENGDKCAWKFGPTTGTIGSGGYNQSLGGYNWLIQMNWENARGGGCDQTLGGTFYTK
jgi:hypothetical protein